MDTPITVSSSLSSVKKPSKKSAVAHSESSNACVPASWDSATKPYGRESSCSPSTLQKVKNWINSNQLNVESTSSYKPNTGLGQFDNGSHMEGDFLVARKVCPNFSTSEIIEDKMIEDELKRYCNVTTHICFERGPTALVTPKIPDELPRGGSLKKYSHPKSIRRRKLIRSANFIEKEVSKSDDSSSDVPLSPESEKKKELCSYLQLMKPTDKKTVMILQNRRSMRVKNLNIMQEKKELEKKLKEGHLEDTNDNSSSNLQSSENVNDDFQENTLKCLEPNTVKEALGEKFHFPLPKDILKKVITDFDGAIKEDWKKKLIKKPLVSNNGNVSQITKANCDIVSCTEAAKHQLSPKQDLNNDLNKTNAQSRTRLGIKRRSVIGQDNEVGSEKKMKSNKNGDQTIQTKEEDQKNNSQPKTRETSHVMYAALNDGKTTRVAKEISKTNSKCINNDSQEAHLQAYISSIGHVSVPNLTLPLTMDGIDITKSPIKANCESETIKTKSLSQKKKSTKSARVSTVKPVIQNAKNFRKNNPSSIQPSIVNSLPSNHVERTVPTSKKKINVKKRKSMPALARNSSFKIKLVSKNRSSGSPNKANKSPVRKVSNSPSTPSHKKAGGKKESPSTKKENFKEKGHGPDMSKNITVPLTKIPLKDTNENPLKNEFLDLPLLDVNQKPLEPLSQVLDANRLPKTDDPVSITRGTKLARSGSTPRTKKIINKKVNTRGKSPPTAIIAFFKNPVPLQSDTNVTEKKTEFYSQILDAEKSPEENDSEILKTTMSAMESYAMSPKSNTLRCLTPYFSKELLPQDGDGNSEPTKFISFKKGSGNKPLHNCLNPSKPKVTEPHLERETSSPNWASGSPSHRQKKNQHSIHISREHGPVLKMFYMEYNLVLCQDSLISLWTQTALGNVLGAQNMWIFKGNVPRLSMNNNCVFKESLEMVVSADGNVAYTELWIKEHESDIRESPVADVFAIVYFWKKGHSGLDKKVLQLENINGFADDVQYSILKSSPKIVVSWHLANNDLENKRTSIHCYKLASDFQSVCNISEFEAVDHYVSSLHNIEGCDTLIMGCGENKITLWNLDNGYVAATIEMLEIKSPLSTLWVKCDRGILFTLQQCVDRELRLIAIHGMNHSWKKLASYVPPDEYDRIKGVCVENGIVLAVYDQGIICWNAQTADTVLETSQTEAEFISGKYIISIADDQVKLRHAITHLLSAEES